MAEDFSEKDSSKGKANYKEVGRSGTFITSENIEDDYLSELNGIDGQTMYHKMLLSESQIRKLYHAVCNPIKSAEWSVEPASDDTKDIEYAALMNHILFTNFEHGFKAKLDEILTFPWHGHAVFEVIHENRNEAEFGPYTGLNNLAFRDQRTLDKWVFTREGKLEKIHQKQSGDVEIDTDILVETLLIFYNEQKGNDSGFPFLRMLYGNYKRKLLYKQLQAIGIERAAIPVPHLKLPASVDYDSAEYGDAVEQLEAFTQAEQAFFVTPAEYELSYNQATTFDPAKVQVAIKAENEEIAGSLVAMWLEMGIGGNSAVGSSTGISADFFRDGIEYLADKIVDTINLKLIPNLMALNFGEIPGPLPKLKHSGIADEAGKELMEVVTGYVDKGVITPDEQLEDHVRSAHGLPKKAEGEIIDNKETQDDKTPPDDPAPDKKPDEVVELSSKGKPKTPKALIDRQAPIVSASIVDQLTFSSAKYIADVMSRYKQLGDSKKQNATNKTVMSGQGKLKKALRKNLAETSNLAIGQVRKEVPNKKEIKLNDSERDMLRMVEKFGDISEIKLNDLSTLPAHIQVLIAKQSDLISSDSLADLKKRIDFSFSGIELKSSDENVIKQSMEEEADKFIQSSQIDLKGVNATSTMVNESREAFFFEPDVLEEIHSFTFVNFSPKSAICKELAGTTFNTNDAESLRYTPPLHHNCKSYLRANLKVSKGTEKLEVSTLSPSANAKKSVTL